MTDRQRQNFISGTLGAQLNAGATSMTSNALMDLDTVAGPNYAVLVLDPLQVNGEPEIVYVTAHTLGQPTATISRGEELTTDRIHPIASTWKHAPVADDFGATAGSGGSTDRLTRTSGDISVSSQTWANVDNGLDIALSAAIGDFVEYGVSGLWGSEAANGCLDVVSLVAGSPVNSWADDAAPDNTHEGAAGWLGDDFGVGGVRLHISGSVVKELLAGDISAGTVTLRLRARVTAATAKTLFATAVNPLQVWARNHG